MSTRIYRVPRKRKYKVIDLGAIEDDPSLSWKAVGLLTYMVTRPEGWEVFQADLVLRHSDGEASVRAGIGELIKRGYVRRERVQGGWNWYVSEIRMKAEEWEGFFEALEPASSNFEGVEIRP